MKEYSNMLGKMGSKAQHTANPAATPTKYRDNKAVNISKPGKAQAGHCKIAKTKAKAVSKIRIGRTQEEFRRLNETDILSRVIELEMEIGKEPSLLDILCRFSRAEIDAVRDSLLWLYPNLKEKKPATVDAELELVIT